jgi:hypothetical protein
VLWWGARQLAVWTLGFVALRVALVPAEACPPATRPDAERSLDAAAAWLERGAQPDGRFLYGYFRDSGEVAGGYNTTRHAGVLTALYQVAAAGDASRLDAADAGLAYVLRNLVEHDGWAAFAPAGEDPSVGATALAFAALAHRREATGERVHDDLLRRLARFLVAQQRSDGSVLKYWSRDSREPVPGVFGQWSTGEAFWALALAASLFPAEDWERAAHRTAHYLATHRDAEEGYLPRLPDHWAAYGLAELSNLDETEVAYARRLAGYFGARTRFESTRRDDGLTGALWSGTGSAAGLGTVGEALGALGRLSLREPRLADLRADLGERATCVAGMLVSRQSDRSEPWPVGGAWFTDGYTQMDDQQHAISALLAARAELE